MMELPVLNDCKTRDGRMCGACCFEVGVQPFDLSELDRLPDDLRAEVNYEMLFALASGNRQRRELQPCPWLDVDSMLCLHYEHRPKVCRDFQPGSPACIDSKRRLFKC